MRNFLAVAFRNERDAFAGLDALEQLAAAGAITVHEAAVVERRSDGAIVPLVSRTGEPALRAPGIGALLGLLAGVAAGPIGAVIGGAVGVVGGALGEAIRSGAGDEYIRRIGEHLKPGTFAVIADVHENERGPIDLRMAKLGGSVLREARKAFGEELLDEREEKRRAGSSGTPVA